MNLKMIKHLSNGEKVDAKQLLTPSSLHLKRSDQ